MNSSFVLNFVSPLINLDSVVVQDTSTPSSSIFLQYSDTTIQGTILTSGDTIQDIQRTITFINNNYNATNRYTISPNYGNNTITVTDNRGSSTFTEVFNGSLGRLTTSLNNVVVTPVIAINDVSISGVVGSECTLLDINITTSVQADEITSPLIQPVTSNPFTVNNISRDIVNDILIDVNNTTSKDTVSIYVPPINSSYFSVNVTNTPTGGTVTVMPVNNRPPYFTIQYSIDGVNYYNTNSFSNVPQGSYNAHVRDSLGCETSFPFEVTNFQPNVTERSAYFKVSQQNSLISVKREVIDNITVFRNPTNTLSFEEETELNLRNFKQLYNTTDGLITQQYRSNYDNVEVKLINCEGLEVNLTSTQKTSNFNVTDVRDISLIGAVEL